MQFRFLLTALMFFTRIPVTGDVPYSQIAQRQALKFFPVIGWLVGAVGALVFYLAQLWLPPSVAVVLGIVAMLLTTGAMHEDGLADSIDGFGGGHDAERVLAIMKDSHLGSFGAIALIVILLLKTLLLLELTAAGIGRVCAAILFAQAASRFAVLLIPVTLDYVQLSPESKSQAMVGQRMPPESLFIGAVAVVIPLLFLPGDGYWTALILAIALSYGLSRYYRARIDGYSGDCLGATQQLTESMIYLSLLVAWTST